MAFPTIPTGGRIVSALQANTTATRTFPSLTGLTKNSGDLLIAIVFAYQTSVGTDAAFSGWTGSFTEFGDRATATTMAIGMAYKWSDGTETGTFAVTQAATITGHAAMIVLSIPGAHASTIPVAGTKVDGTSGAADIASLNPGTWDVEDTLWIAVGGAGEVATTSTWFGMSNTTQNASPWTTVTLPANYTNGYATGVTADAAGAVEGAVGFRQLAAASDDPAAFAPDLSNARNSSLLIAVRPPTVLSADGTEAVTVTLTGVGQGIYNASGNEAITATTTGAALLEVAVEGTRPITVTLVGEADVTSPSVNADGNLAITATLVGASAHADGAGTLAVTATAAGAALTEHPADGSLAVTATATGVALLEVGAAGTQPVTVTLVGEADVSAPAGTVNASGNLAITATSAGAAALDLPADGSLAVTATLAGVGDIGALPIEASGDLVIWVTLAGGEPQGGRPLHTSSTYPAVPTSTSRSAASASSTYSIVSGSRTPNAVLTASTIQGVP